MKVLVVHASKTGSTADIAEWIADEVRTAGHTVVVGPAQDAPDPVNFDAVVVGSGIRAGHWHTAAETWLRTHADQLRTMPVVTFSGSLRAEEETPQMREEVAGYTRRVVEPLGIEPVAHGSLIGAYDPAKVSVGERLIMRGLRQDGRDNRDEERVRAFAREALAALG